MENTVSEYGTESVCPKNTEFPHAHVPLWSSAHLEPDGDGFYIDINCANCGRSGCLGSVKSLLSDLEW